MYAVRCRNQNRGFRVEGVYYPGDRWLLVSEISEAMQAEPMLVVQQVEGPADPALFPFPAVFPDGSERLLPSLEEVLRGWTALQQRVTSLEKALETLASKLPGGQARETKEAPKPGGKR